MPKVQAKVIATKEDGGKLLAKIQFNRKLPKVGENLIVKWGALRSISQNSLLWAYYDWAINHGGLKENHGYYSKAALHINIKEYMTTVKGFSKDTISAVEDAPFTSVMDKVEFGEFFDALDSAMWDIFECDMSPFWEAYKNDYSMQ